MQIREASPGDEKAIFDLIYALAVYEKAPEQVTNSPEQLRKDLFEERICHAFVAEEEQHIIGFSLYYFSYSTWKGKCLYLEDFLCCPKKEKMELERNYFEKLLKKPEI